MSRKRTTADDLSFSLKIKEEITSRIPKDINGRQALIAGVFCSQASEGMNGPAAEVRLTGNSTAYISQVLKLEGIESVVDGRERICVGERDIEAFRTLYGAFFSEGAANILSSVRGFERYFLRGAYLACGYCSDPQKTYRIEFHLRNSDSALMVETMLRSEGFNPLRTERDRITVIYLKNGDNVSDMLSVMGADSAKLQFELVRTDKELMGSVVRTVNCDSANTRRQAEAAAARGELIGKLLASDKAATLPPELLEAAKVHMENPGASIAEMGRMMDPPIGKSGMNHRLKKLIDIASSL